MESKDAMDVYGMNMKMIKKCSHYLLEHLADLIDACFQQVIVPNNMIISKVVPVYKPGDRKNSSNYKLIFIPSILSKLLEVTLLSRFVSSLEKNHILVQNQFGIHRGRSSIDATLTVLTFVSDTLEGGQDSVMLMYILSKAYPVMVRSYFKDRKQMIYLNEALNEPRNIEQGVV